MRLVAVRSSTNYVNFEMFLLAPAVEFFHVIIPSCCFDHQATSHLLWAVLARDVVRGVIAITLC